ncbi:MAG: hypothetical protein IPN69_19135 [Acidobacteria bacterium]|nr:hypothetical protein [Acidobacteriota bacterium]
MTEFVEPANDAAKVIEKTGSQNTNNGVPVPQISQGVFWDVQIRGPGSITYNEIKTTQRLLFRNGNRGMFVIKEISIVMNDVERTISITPGKVRKLN